MASEEAKRTTVMVHGHTKADLDSIRHSGQSYDGLIQELIKFWQEQKKGYWVRRRAEGAQVLAGDRGPGG